MCTQNWGHHTGGPDVGDEGEIVESAKNHPRPSPLTMNSHVSLSLLQQTA